MSTTSSIRPQHSKHNEQCEQAIDGSEGEEENSESEDFQDADEEAADAIRDQGEIDKDVDEDIDKDVDEHEEEEQTQNEGVAPTIARDPGQLTAKERAIHESPTLPTGHGAHIVFEDERKDDGGADYAFRETERCHTRL